MKTLIVNVVGYNGAGKTTFAQTVAAKYCVTLLSFRELARHYAISMGYTGVREYYFHIDKQDFIHSINVKLLRDIMSFSRTHNKLIIEGLPSICVINELKKHCGVVTIYIETPLEIRQDRMLRRSQRPIEEIEREEKEKTLFKMALGIDNVIRQADHIICGNQSQESMMCDFQSLNII